MLHLRTAKKKLFRIQIKVIPIHLQIFLHLFISY